MDYEKHSFDSDGIPIAFYTAGEGPAFLLVHGFASNAATNWINTGWLSHLVGRGYHVILLDCRGHGQSGKPYEPECYTTPEMAGDVVRLVSHLNLSDVTLMGYSMGARISAYVAASGQGQLSKLILAGMGDRLLEPDSNASAIVSALLAPSLREIDDQTGRQFRAFAMSTESDLKALAACMQSQRLQFTPDFLAQIAVPTLVVVGETDTIAGSPDGLARFIPGAKAATIPKRDHMRTVGDMVYRKKVDSFLSQKP